MSHTYQYKAPGYECIRVIVNSDWSGWATIMWQHEGGGEVQKVEVPGLVLKAIFKVEGRKLFEDSLSKFLDHLEGPAS